MRKLLVVTYHYFRERKPSGGIYPVTKREMERQLEEIGRRFSFVGQEELAEHLRAGSFPDRDCCLVTFDDGLKEQMAAFRFLRDAGIPAVFYVPTAPLDRGTVLDVHKLHHVRTVMDDGELFSFLDREAGIGSYRFDSELIAAYYRWDPPLSQKVKYFMNFVLQGEPKEALMRKLFARVVDDEEAFVRDFYMSHDDLRELAGSGSLGAHGATHRPLAQLPLEESAAEIRQSVERLRSLTGGGVHSFSYPYGARTTVPADVESVMKSAGVAFALTTTLGVNTMEDLLQRYWLKRLDTNDAPGGRSHRKELVA